MSNIFLLFSAPCPTADCTVLSLWGRGRSLPLSCWSVAPLVRGLSSIIMAVDSILCSFELKCQVRELGWHPEDSVQRQELQIACSPCLPTGTGKFVLLCLTLCTTAPNVAQSWKGRAQHPEKNPDILLRTVEMEVAVSPAVTVRAKPVNLHTHHKNMDNIARLWKWIWYWKRIRKLLAACRFSVRWLHSELLAETTVAIVDTRCEQVLKVSRLHPTLLNIAKPGNCNSSEKWQSIHIEDKDEILENMVLKLWWFSKKEGHTVQMDKSQEVSVNMLLIKKTKLQYYLCYKPNSTELLKTTLCRGRRGKS